MASRRKEEEDLKPRRRPATTPESRENQLVVLATDAAETQLRDGTASSQVIVHYLKLGSTREKLEQERLARENILLEAKAEAIQSAKRVEELYMTALDAMKRYAGHEPMEIDYDED